MINRLQPLESTQIDTIHQACMQILGNTGIIFKDAEALEIFKNHGFKVEGQTVFISEKQVLEALKTVPSEFTLLSRNPEKSIKIGGENFALGPGWAAPYIIDSDGTRRSGTLTDFTNFCKLVQTSPCLDLTAGSMAIPAELPPGLAATEMLASSFILCDKPLVANPCCKENGRELAEIANIVWGQDVTSLEHPVSIVSVNPLSPLSYSDDTIGGLIEFAKQGQALLISSMVLAGISGPITVAGSAVLELTECLAGIVLAQLINPGTPCVIGGTSCAADLRTGGVNLGNPAFLQLMSISSQMASHYNLPCRYGGGLTDSFSNNLQAGVESALAIGTSLISGIHFMHQACGILGAYSAISFEKFVIDEEIGAMIKYAIKPLEISETSIALELIERVGSGGSYLMQPETAKACRTAFFPTKLTTRGTYESWKEKKMDDISLRASKLVQQRLENYVQPDIDPTIEKDLRTYVQSKTNL
ncbi:MAG: trimethylamine methyltransferase family protein [Desulforhopalus sp.]